MVRRNPPNNFHVFLARKLETAPEIFLTQDGSHSVVAHQFGVSYHSKYGAVRESMHVFISAGLLPNLLPGRQLSVLEAGLGTGLNAFMAYLEGEKRQTEICYEAIEAFPLESDFAVQLNFPEILQAKGQEGVFHAIHRLPWGQHVQLSPYFKFKKVLERFEQYRPEKTFDVVFFDAFSPGAQPELWQTEVLAIFHEALRSGGILVTYCAKGEVKRRLKAIGFQVETLPGPPGKREMVRAVKV